MLNAVRSSARAQHPIPSSIFSYSHIITTGKVKPSGIRFAQAVSGPKQPDSCDEMDPKQGPESKTSFNVIRDTMSSFGEVYATRADEEGFGGTYGGSQYLREDTEDKNVRGKDPAETDHSQVKEKEKARSQAKTKVPS